MKAQREYIAKVEEYNQKVQSGGFVDESAREKLKIEIEGAKVKSEKAEKTLSRFDEISDDSPLAEVHKSIKQQYDADGIKDKKESVEIKDEPQKAKNTYITTGLSKLNKSERKLVAKIMTIVSDLAPKDVAEKIIERITKDLK